MHQQTVHLDQASRRHRLYIVYLSEMQTNQCLADQVAWLLTGIFFTLTSIQYGH